MGESEDGRAARKGSLVDGARDCCVRAHHRRSGRHDDRSMKRGNADRAELGAIRSGLPGCRKPGRKLIAMEMGDRDKLGDEEEKPPDGGQPLMPRAQLDAACDHRSGYWSSRLSAQQDTINRVEGPS